MPAIVVRPYRVDDYDALLAVQLDCFPAPFPAELLWSRAQVASHVAVFPDGALCAEVDGRLAGSATAHIIRWDPGSAAHTWAEASDHGFLRNHDPRGDTLYGVDVAVLPAFRRLGVARELYRARYALVRRLGLVRFMAGSRLAGYRAHAARLSPEAYAEEVVAGRLADPVITPQLKAGLAAVRVVRGYLPDEEACDCALLMEWRNDGRAA